MNNPAAQNPGISEAARLSMGSGGGAASKLGGFLAAAGVASLSIQHNVGPANLGTYMSGIIPKVPVHMPISPLGIKASPLKMYNGVPGGDGGMAIS